MRPVECRRFDPGCRHLLVLSICSLLVAPLSVLAQTTGTVEGTVVDQSGAPLPGLSTLDPNSYSGRQDVGGPDYGARLNQLFGSFGYQHDLFATGTWYDYEVVPGALFETPTKRYSAGRSLAIQSRNSQSQ